MWIMTKHVRACLFLSFCYSGAEKVDLPTDLGSVSRVGPGTVGEKRS